jgi:hypothetical protein
MAPGHPSVNRFTFASNQILHPPHVIDVEIAQVLRRYVRSAAKS